MSTTNLFADEFLESCGAITFNHQNQICILYNPRNKQYYLAKGRRNCNESRTSAAIREFQEETGYGCKIVSVRMATRAPPVPEESGYDSTEAVIRSEVIDPFALSVREEGRSRKKFIWWFIAEVEEGGRKYERLGEDSERCARWVDVWEAMDLLKFESDREVVQKAWNIYQDRDTCRRLPKTNSNLLHQ